MIVRIDMSKQEAQHSKIITTDTSSSHIHIEILSIINNDVPIRDSTNILINCRYVPITDTNPIYLLLLDLDFLSMKMSKFSIIMSIVKAINDV